MKLQLCLWQLNLSRKVCYWRSFFSSTLSSEMCPSQIQSLQRLLYHRHKAPSETAQAAEPGRWCKRCKRALTQVSYGETEIEVDAVFQLFSYAVLLVLWLFTWRTCSVKLQPPEVKHRPRRLQVEENVSTVSLVSEWLPPQSANGIPIRESWLLYV